MKQIERIDEQSNKNLGKRVRVVGHGGEEGHVGEAAQDFESDGDQDEETRPDLTQGGGGSSGCKKRNPRRMGTPDKLKVRATTRPKVNENKQPIV